MRNCSEIYYFTATLSQTAILLLECVKVGHQVRFGEEEIRNHPNYLNLDELDRESKEDRHTHTLAIRFYHPARKGAHESLTFSPLPTLQVTALLNPR